MATKRKGLNRVPGTTITKPELDLPVFDGTPATERKAWLFAIDELMKLGVPKAHLAKNVLPRMQQLARAGGDGKASRDLLLAWVNDSKW